MQRGLQRSGWMFPPGSSNATNINTTTTPSRCRRGLVRGRTVKIQFGPQKGTFRRFLLQNIDIPLDRFVVIPALFQTVAIIIIGVFLHHDGIRVSTDLFLQIIQGTTSTVLMTLIIILRKLIIIVRRDVTRYIGHSYPFVGQRPYRGGLAPIPRNVGGVVAISALIVGIHACQIHRHREVGSSGSIVIRRLDGMSSIVVVDRYE
mmetsp:Transcript_22029/g.41634  ORF Transcript_22029/g.41634 Transcript_22029/m.41634 type:complete len:204 (-) Transcript_22029:515-1126(-)